jgi:hypothetical protein
MDSLELRFRLPDWVGALESRGIVVMRDVLRREATRVLREYAEGGGTIYNAAPPRQGRISGRDIRERLIAAHS